jgi:hypothetical protein
MGAIFVGILALAAWIATSTLAQSASPQATPKVTAEQQKQLDQLKQLEDQLTKDRTAVHDAISKYGWDSDQTDAAQEQLFRNRTEYRQLRRSLRQAGVPVPPAGGFGPGGPGPGPGGMGMGMGGSGGHGMMGRRMCDCPCMGK